MSENHYELIVGLEIHVELATKSKMFCQCKADWFEMKANTNICPVCLGLPGALPVPNATAIEYCQKLALALGCTITADSKFDRKHYFYPDLPKGYQISQYDLPFGRNGIVKLSNSKNQSFRIHRVHMEEDTGKLNHHADSTTIDFNRSGVPLVEIVTEADFRSSDDVKNFLQELHSIITNLGVSDANMEKGSMRLEPNISLRKFGQTNFPPYKVEVKNINSFRYVKQAIDYEITRQSTLLDQGITPDQETRGFNEKTISTFSQRKKEEAADYRYFPEPDIPPIHTSAEKISSLVSCLPLLPVKKFEILTQKYSLKEADAFILSRDNHTYEKYLAATELVTKQVSEDNTQVFQGLANALINKKISLDEPVEKIARSYLNQNKKIEFDPKELEQIVNQVISKNSSQVEQYKSGKTGLLMFFVGAVMKSAPQKFPAPSVMDMIKAKLG